MYREPNPFLGASCPSQARVIQHVFHAEKLSERQCEKVVEHIAQCARCAAIYETLCGAQNELLDEADRRAGRPKREFKSSLTDQEAVTALWRHIEVAETTAPSVMKIPARFRLAKVAALVACVLLVCFGWRMGSGLFKSTASHVPAAEPVAPQVAYSQDDSLIESIHGTWADAPLDLETVDFTAWRDDNREWFALQFPWVSKVELALRSDHGEVPDMIDILMVSGALRAFYFDPTQGIRGAPSQPGQDTLARLARFYRADALQLHRAAGSEAPELQANATRDDGLRGWRAALARDNAQADLCIASVTAANELALTRCTAYLWSKAHPQQAAQLFAGDWLEPLHAEALVALRCRRVAGEWLGQPKTAECQPKIRALRRQLIQSIDDLLSRPQAALRE